MARVSRSVNEGGHPRSKALGLAVPPSLLAQAKRGDRIKSNIRFWPKAEPHQPGSIPVALMAAAAAGEVRNLNNTLAASGSLAVVRFDTCKCPLMAPKRTSVTAVHMSAFGSGHGLAHCKCLLLTQSGHFNFSPRPIFSVSPIRLH